MSDAPEYRQIFTGEVVGGRFKPDDPGRWTAMLLRFNARRLTVVVSRARRIRTDSQNRYYWSMIIPVFSEWSGYEKDEAHELLKSMFLKAEVELPDGTRVERVKSTTTLDTTEFTEYVERTRRFLAQHGWQVPAPGEVVA